MSVKSDSAISLKTDDIDWTNPRLPISRALRKEYVLVVFAAEKIEPGPDVTLHFDISIWRGPLPFGLPRPAFRPVTRWNVRLTVSAFGIGDGRIIVLFEEGNAARFCFQFRATVSELAVCHVSPGRIDRAVLRRWACQCEMVLLIRIARFAGVLNGKISRIHWEI